MTEGFHEVRLPIRLSLGMLGGPEWRTEVLTLASGLEIRNSAWSQSRRRWDIGGAITDLAKLQELVSFFEARRGRLYGFRFRDPMDHTSARPGEAIRFDDQEIGIGDGQAQSFQLRKGEREIFKPVVGTIEIGLDGGRQSSRWQGNVETGEIKFETPPPAGAKISAGFEFDCPVRFENDQIQALIEAFGAGRVVSMGLVELRAGQLQ